MSPNLSSSLCFLSAIAEFTSLDETVVRELKFSKNIIASDIDPTDLKKASDLYKELELFEGVIINSESMLVTF